MPAQFAEHPLDIWQVETLRMTAFPAPVSAIDASSWWEALMKEPPEKRTTEPRRKSQRDEGSLGDGKLILGVDPVRIDWLYTLREDHKVEIEGIQTIGNFPETLETFLPLINRWFALNTCPPMQRLAFGAILMQPAETRQAGYQKLSGYLHAVTLDSEGISDFLYQINRRRDSTCDIPELRINRLSQWSVAARGVTEISVGPEISKLSRIPLNFACRLSLDINTVQEFTGELPQECTPQIFQELVALGCEVASQGDIP
jgi:hypothetical protein